MPRGETITVAAGQLVARLMNEAAATLEDIQSAIRRAADKRVELLVLPECAYPAYLLGSVTSYRAGDHLASGDFLAWLSEQARRHRLHVISGFVEDDGQRLHNAAVFLDDAGREIGRTRKCFLWNVDQDWFSPGREIRAFDSAIGRIGIAICAETRIPEVVATLVADGAELIANPTCWINVARDPGRFENLQVEFLIASRAREFGVPLVCADKAGLELGAVGYVGQSRIVRADGSVAAEAPPTGEAVIAARLVRHRPRRVWVQDSRRARLLADQPAVRPEAREQILTVAAVPTAAAGRWFAGQEAAATAALDALAARGVQMLLTNVAHEAQGERLATLARARGMHALGFPLRNDVFDLGPARVASLPAHAVRGFAAARALALDGAEMLLCFDAPEDLGMLRTRAAENRIFVVAAGQRWAAIIGPGGEVLARAQDALQEARAAVDLGQAADKLVAPRTDILTQRQPSLYRF